MVGGRQRRRCIRRSSWGRRLHRVAIPGPQKRGTGATRQGGNARWFFCVFVFVRTSSALSDLMTGPTSKVQQALIEALRNTAKSPDLTEAEGEWLRQFVMRLVAEFAVVREHQEVEPETPIAA